MSLSVREMQKKDIPLIVRYWLKSDPDFLTGMGVDLDKVPKKEALTKMLSAQIETPIPEKTSYALIWMTGNEAVGHSNVNNITFGKEAFMHLHLWQPAHRQKGMGTALVKMSLPCFFEKLKLKTLFCEPYALNPAPNKTLEKVGFEFEKRYRTVPGYLNFEQEVNRWRLTEEQYRSFSKTSEL